MAFPQWLCLLPSPRLFALKNVKRLALLTAHNNHLTDFDFFTCLSSTVLQIFFFFL